MNRRSFLSTTVSSSLLAGAPYVIGQSTDRVYRAALIGSGWWGMNLLTEGLASKRLKCVALADVDQNARESSADELEGLTGTKPKVYNDYRELLAKEKPDVVIIATPDHWHALTTIAAVKAGAHVLVGDITYPQGNGYLTMSVGATGAVTWGGKLADGTAITGSSTVAAGGEIPSHQLSTAPHRRPPQDRHAGG